MDKEQTLQNLIATVRALDERVKKLESAGPNTPAELRPATQEKKLSISEFLRSLAPANGVQITLAVAYFLEKYDGVSPFNSKDIERAFRSAREPVPSNINDKANMCVKNGYFMEHTQKKDSMKAWLVTRTGDELIQSQFGKIRP